MTSMFLSGSRVKALFPTMDLKNDPFSSAVWWIHMRLPTNEALRHRIIKLHSLSLH